MEDVQMKKAEKPMGKTVKWSEAEVTDAAKHVFLGTEWKGIYIGKDSWTNPKGKDIALYKFRLENEEVVTVWETAMIHDGMEQGDNGAPIPVGAVVQFVHKGKKQGADKSNNPYHVIEIFFGIPSPAMRSASATTTPPSASLTAKTSNPNTGGW